eukprot:4962278-Alexandrium_andersonii.AAC.1
MGEPQPIAAGVASSSMAPAVPGDEPPPMAEPVVTELPFTSLPGLTDDANPIMKACRKAWNQLVTSVGPEFAST